MNFKKLVLCAFVAAAFTACSSDDNSTLENEQPGNNTQFPMTAKINGTFYGMANPIGSDFATSTITSDYPNEEYIQLQGRPNLSFMTEINIWIDRDDLQPGTYEVGPETDGFTTHIRLIDNFNPVSVVTRSGHITITEVNTAEKIVMGTFEFETSEWGEPTEPQIHNVTEGTFNYRYDVED